MNSFALFINLIIFLIVWMWYIFIFIWKIKLIIFLFLHIGKIDNLFSIFTGNLPDFFMKILRVFILSLIIFYLLKIELDFMIILRRFIHENYFNNSYKNWVRIDKNLTGFFYYLFSCIYSYWKNIISKDIKNSDRLSISRH